MNPLELAQGMTDEILEVIHRYDESMPLATALGVLEIVKQQLIQDANDEDDEL
jgi:hypothetical protein